ncbi:MULTISPECIES: hemolysin family protein [unclassified Pseudodesulfovibrio]|uniref:hemolysin family protein n=1 Tax=unclassified Pseudodesulfovibrio TaxID=2661612 RepID=UPI000FEBBDBD|nr:MULTISPECIES: hemolysin family protein [unclassified Pseudodesulfovibrio]MCJ2162941.1 hemolysin family protein [Pseudodesulfovibrio sp. S3-i]RWU06941.1 HlyC/CorC family transporter [Pseudodesulfovibrio sp. S3]
MLELIIAVSVAVFVSMFCSVAEAALYSMSWADIQKLKDSGRKSAALLHKLRSRIDEPITAILTLNTCAHTAGAAVAGWAWANLYGKETLWLFTIGFTVIILIFTEILPKTLGVVYSDAIAPPLARPLNGMVWLFRPLIAVMGVLSRAVSRKDAKPDHTEDDIRAIVSLTRRSGVIKPYEEESIRNILSLDCKTVERIMTPRTVVFSLPVDMTVAEARESHPEWPHSRIPVYEEDPEDIVGVVYRRQVLEALADDRDDLKLSDIMRPVRFVLETITLDKLLVKFLGSRLHLCVVLDEYGGVAGVVTLEDVLEEILGSEIVDETDQVVDMRELARMQRDELTASLEGAADEKKL